MNTYVIYWKDGTTSVIQGKNIAEAFRNAGYSSGAISSVDFYTVGEKPEFVWTGKMWKHI